MEDIEKEISFLEGKEQAALDLAKRLNDAARNYEREAKETKLRAEQQAEEAKWWRKKIQEKKATKKW